MFLASFYLNFKCNLTNVLKFSELLIYIVNRKEDLLFQVIKTSVVYLNMLRTMTPSM